MIVAAATQAVAIFHIPLWFHTMIILLLNNFRCRPQEDLTVKPRDARKVFLRPISVSPSDHLTIELNLCGEFSMASTV